MDTSRGTIIQVRDKRADLDGHGNETPSRHRGENLAISPLLVHGSPGESGYLPQTWKE